MVRPQNKVWEYFIQLEKVSKNQYYYVSCKYCDNEGMDAPLEGRIFKMEKHLSKCSAYIERNNTGIGHCSTSSLPRSSCLLKRARSQTQPSALSTSKLNTGKLQKIDKFIDRKFTKSDVKVLHRLLLEMIADCELSFRWVEKPSVKRLFGFLRPSVINELPSRSMLSGKLLEEYALATRSEIATAQLIENAIIATEEQLNLSIGSVVTDDAGYCARAKRILALRFPNKYFGRCYAHQVNLMVKDVLKVVNPELIDRGKKLVATYNRSTSKWLRILIEECEQMYGTYLSLIQACETRWNSMQGCFASILRIQSALRVVEAKYGAYTIFPQHLRVSNDFFEELAVAETLILPLTKASYMMQRDSNTLADVVNMFGYIYIKFQESEKYGFELVKQLEKRWSQQEHPLLILAYFLHPKYVNNFRKMAISVSDFGLLNMIKFAVLYYKKFVSDISCDDLNAEVSMWYHNKSKDAIFAFGLPMFEFWYAIKGEFPHLSKLALVILSFSAQSATCERLFSAFGNFKTKNRNRLHSSRMHYLTQVKRGVLLLDETEHHNKVRKVRKIISADELPRAMKTNISINNDDTKEDENGGVGGDDCDDDEHEDDTIITEKYIDEWVEALDNLESIHGIEYEEGSEIHEMDSHIARMAYNDGATFREQHPYPDKNVTYFPQEKLSNTRKTKISLQKMFNVNDIAIDIDTDE